MKKISSPSLNKNEITAIIIASIAFGFVLAFKKWGDEEFSAITGLLNWGLYFLISLLTYLLYILAQKIIAKKNDLETTVQLWKAKRFWFRNVWPSSKLKKPIPIGIIISLILTFVSIGNIKFAGLLETKAKQSENVRLTKKFKRMTEFESAIVSTAGPVFVLLVSSILAIFLPNTAFVETTYLIALSAMIPIGALDGIKAAFSSLPLYIITMIIMLLVIPALITGIQGLAILSSIILFFYFLFLYIVKV